MNYLERIFLLSFLVKTEFLALMLQLLQKIVQVNRALE